MSLGVCAPTGLVVLVFNPSESDADVKELITYNSHEGLS